ncbi:DNA-directed RNA polymerase sigma-70 factor [Cellulomonas chitinilytica]|uniref:DNA-directed RNA polymerase sigma-70 factor n=1 Tax=Cellulomonas chitinilytica TaxID=398759 RepID=A0A919P7H0_9CELL|nr:sigma-70 family RNA polymerase sigma factor [Cellulomonas chitinilytica]GIG23685.1 DNA-directed RNA polymerase sigma-70 factor [Cellulomonas chitinilytica]
MDESDGDLARAVNDGDAACLGILLERHRADMRAIAVARLGYGPAAEDAVQDAMVTALSAWGSLRDPDAVGAWLRAIVRNTCRMHVRRTRPVAPLRLDVAAPGSVEDELDRHALRDFVWHAVSTLTEPLQLAVVLRYFGGGHSYAEIAAICDVPVGTVRSRLHEARRQLTTALLDGEAVAHPDVDALARRRGGGLRGLLDAAEDGPALARVVADLAHPDMVVSGWWGTVHHARWLFEHILRSDAEDGVHERVVDVMASSRFTVMECDLVSPSWDPTHCPPSVLWLVGMREERIDSVRLYHPAPA